MTEHDLQARPIYHHKRDSIEARAGFSRAIFSTSDRTDGAVLGRPGARRG